MGRTKAFPGSGRLDNVAASSRSRLKSSPGAPRRGPPSSLSYFIASTRKEQTSLPPSGSKRKVWDLEITTVLLGRLTSELAGELADLLAAGELGWLSWPASELAT